MSKKVERNMNTNIEHSVHKYISLAKIVSCASPALLFSTTVSALGTEIMFRGFFNF